MLRFLVWAISAALRPRALLVAENVCLRQQLGVLQRRLSLPETCAVERHDHPVGDRPTRQLSLQPVAIGAVVEVTKRLKPSMERVT